MTAVELASLHDDSSAWLRAVDTSGRVYYWHRDSRETRWEEPVTPDERTSDDAPGANTHADEDDTLLSAPALRVGEFSADETRRERPFTLALLTTTLVFSYADRQVLNSLFEEIKSDLQLTDTQLGVLGGIAVSLCGALFGIPLARAAEQHSRRRVLVACLVAWSFATAAGGLATSFVTLLLARICVGIGEAGAVPISLALIADCYPQAERSRAIAVYYTGIPAGIIVGLILGGWLGGGIGWRAALAIVGLPGGAFACFLASRLKEPPRGHSDAHSKALLYDASRILP